MYVHDAKTSALFNDLGIYVLTRLDRDFQGMRSFKQTPALYNMQAQADAAKPAAEWTCKDCWPEVRNSKDQVVQPARPLITKTLLSYLGALATTACHYKYADPRLGGASDSAFRGLLDIFDGVADDKLQKYLARRLTAWYSLFPPGADAADSEADSQEGEEEETQGEGRRVGQTPALDDE